MKEIVIQKLCLSGKKVELFGDSPLNRSFTGEFAAFIITR